MEPFTQVESVAAVVEKDNIDTDMILPVEFMKTVSRAGLRSALFYELRATARDSGDVFVLDRAPFDRAEVLIGGNNFGCGSSREHAVWALLDFGIRAVIAGSFSEIFFNNCVNNGILPIALGMTLVREIQVPAKAGERLVVDLETATIRAGGKEYLFQPDDRVRTSLLEGTDDIVRTLRLQQQLDEFELRQQRLMPWIYKRGG